MHGKVFAGSVVLHAAAVVAAALVLPERVPTRFGGGGGADEWSSRAEAVASSALAGTLVAGLFAGLAAWVPRLPLEVVNVPNAAFWKSPEHEGELRRRLREDLLGIGTTTVLLLTAVQGALVQAALSGTGRLPWWFFAVLGAWLAGVLGWVLSLALTRYRVPRGPGG
ncbi:hypothetical protein [Kineococcus esterisolvens]|uniref:hypothetical protein n=1 Tax=unclassified Kineococcus TaxID=2621656 RepID=UPI003D7E2838